jgi:hypothetical protein
MQAVFVRSLELAKQSGYLKERRMKVILDTTYILGRGAVKDTYNLLGDRIQQLCRALAHQFQDYFGSSLKGQAEVDWDDEQACNVFLQGIVADAQRLMQLAQERQATLADEDPESQQIASPVKDGYQASSIWSKSNPAKMTCPRPAALRLRAADTKVGQ